MYTNNSTSLSVLPLETYHARKIKRLLALPPAQSCVIYVKYNETCNYDVLIKRPKSDKPGWKPLELYLSGVPFESFDWTGNSYIWCLSGSWAVLDSKRFFEPLLS